MTEHDELDVFFQQFEGPTTWKDRVWGAFATILILPLALLALTLYPAVVLADRIKNKE